MSGICVTSVHLPVTALIGEQMNQSETTEIFVRRLTEHQNRLYGYIYSLIGDHSRAADVVQETNLVMWRKISEYQTDKPFLPWAFAIARFQVLAHLRDSSRDRLLLNEELAETLSQEAEEQAGQVEDIRAALRPCMQLLSSSNRELIEHRYFRERPVAEIAASVGRTASSVKVAMLRIRRKLAECMQSRLSAER